MSENFFPVSCQDQECLHANVWEVERGRRVYRVKKKKRKKTNINNLIIIYPLYLQSVNDDDQVSRFEVCDIWWKCDSTVRSGVKTCHYCSQNCSDVTWTNVNNDGCQSQSEDKDLDRLKGRFRVFIFVVYDKMMSTFISKYFVVFTALKLLWNTPVSCDQTTSQNVCNLKNIWTVE